MSFRVGENALKLSQSQYASTGQYEQGCFVYTYLPPVFEEVLTEHIFSGVLMIQHLGEEQSHFLGS